MRLGFALMRATGHVVYCLVYWAVAAVLLALFVIAVMLAVIALGKEALP